MVGIGDYIHEFLPASPTCAGVPTLVLLHGTGGDERDLLPLGRELSADAALLSPRGQVLEGPVPRWFRRVAEGVFDVDDLVRRTHDLADWLPLAAERHGVDPAELVAVGFSNGANIAASMLLLRPEVLRAAILFAPMLPFPTSDPVDLTAVGVFIGAGRADPICPPEQVEELAATLDNHGASVALFWHAGGHQIDRSTLADATRWLHKLRAATAADGDHPLP